MGNLNLVTCLRLMVMAPSGAAIKPGTGGGGTNVLNGELILFAFGIGGGGGHIGGGGGHGGGGGLGAATGSTIGLASSRLK